jgi:hypothetical protein
MIIDPTPAISRFKRGEGDGILDAKPSSKAGGFPRELLQSLILKPGQSLFAFGESSY